MTTESSSTKLPPVCQWKVGKRIWLFLPIDQRRGVIVFQLIVALMVEAEMLLFPHANDGRHWFSHRWIWVTVTVGCCPGIVLYASSLWALRIQKRRDRLAQAQNG